MVTGYDYNDGVDGRLEGGRGESEAVGGSGH